MALKNLSGQGAVRFSKPIPGGALAGWHWVNPGAPPLLFCHATGFCASAYKQMLNRIAVRFDIYALDMRGHGRTRLPEDAKALRSWDVYAADVAAFLDGEAREGWTIAGHSMGGVTAMLAARGRKDIAALKLIEPVSPPPLFFAIARSPVWPLLSRYFPMARQAAGRRSHWPARKDVMASYQRKTLFKGWADGALADYLEDGLVEDETGARLACDPAWEAATFTAHAHDFWGAVRAAPAPVSVLAAGDKSSTVPAGAAKRFNRAGVRMSRIADTTHLVPMENPEIAAIFIDAGD